MIERQNPKMQRINATKLLGHLDPALVSQITVAVASINENAESIPSMNSVSPKRIVQRFGAFIVSIADG